MVADFRQYYQLNIKDGLRSSTAGDMLDLIPGLMSERYSRFRAHYLAEHPTVEKPEEGLGFLGWSQDSMLLAQIHNAILATGAGKKANKLMILAPKAKAKSVLFAKTIADFSVGRFMSVINSARK